MRGEEEGKKWREWEGIEWKTGRICCITSIGDGRPALHPTTFYNKG